MNILKLRRYFLHLQFQSLKWIMKVSVSQLSLKMTDRPPNVFPLHRPSTQQTIREMNGNGMTSSSQGIKTTLIHHCGGAVDAVGGQEGAPSVSYIPLLPQISTIKLYFSCTVAEHK